MKVNGKNFRTIWLSEDNSFINIIDQRQLPHQFVIEELRSVADMAQAIKDMHLRGAPLIGVAAGYAMYLAALEAINTDNFDGHLAACAQTLRATRPTAVNLQWAIDRQLQEMAKSGTPEQKIQIARETADSIADEDVASCKNIGQHGMQIIEAISNKKNGERINILTHCNAGWLACVDYGTATAPIYEAFAKGIDLHVWVDETRPRNQGANLTAWELLNEGIPHTVITDNAGGHLMQHGMVDMVITGADRVTRSGDVANKIGTYLKALAAADNKIPLYVAFPSSTFDWDIRDGLSEIHIEERSGDEVRYVQGWHEDSIKKVLVTPAGSQASNYGFDVTPSRLIAGLITERGVCSANEHSILELYPGHGGVQEEAISFHCNWIKLPPLELEQIDALNVWREKLYNAGLVGVTPEGIGYGNVSARVWEHQFVITGAATGSIKNLGAEHYALVAGYNVEANELTAKGPIQPSSESLTHAMIYECGQNVNAIFHVHHPGLWRKLMDNLPYTGSDMSYHTPSWEIERLFREHNLAENKMFAMAGHIHGVIVFGNSLQEAGELLFHAIEHNDPFPANVQ
ncbi:MAG TPA: S-methyl-5-thioribose-1-phosphate isomerase [Chitinophagaceae bacterium]|nr:S-methyl-5-thioribose-1-phosphate isomerase [Chitinophagaceae bacterium]